MSWMSGSNTVKMSGTSCWDIIEERLVICRLGLAMFNPRTKFWSTITCNKDMKGSAKRKNSCFEPPFGDLGITHRVHLWRDRKRIVDFLLAIVELFSIALTAEALLSEICRNRRFWIGGSLFTQRNFAADFFRWLLEMHVVDFPLMLIERFCQLSMLRRNERIMVEIVVFERRVGQFKRKFQWVWGLVVHQLLLVSEN